MSDMEIEDITDEEYVIKRAKTALLDDPLSAKSWMITAKTLYPNNFGVQFEAYCIEKRLKHVKEAAKCFSDLIINFQQQAELWKEIENVTAALRADGDTDDPEQQFLCEMFKHISPEVQHKLIICTADHCQDTMEHCRLLLLLLQRFSTAIASYGPRLVDTLISAEKHIQSDKYPLNQFRKLLVCELLPLLASSNVKIDLNQKLLFKLLHKAIEFYGCHLGLIQGFHQDIDQKIENPWQKLFAIVEFLGKQLGWDPNLVNFTTNWSKDSYLQRIVSYYQNNRGYEEKQLWFCVSIFFLYCLYEYTTSLTPEQSPGQPQTAYLLIEAFIDPTLSNPITEPKSKKRKTDDYLYPHISVEKSELKNISANFLVTYNCWDLFSMSDVFHREFYMFFSTYLKLDSLLNEFLIDYSIYKGKYDEALMYLQKSTHVLNKYIRMASILYVKKKYNACFEQILSAVPLLPNVNMGTLSNNLISGGTQRHLHFLPLTNGAILQYFVKILLRSIKENSLKHAFSELSVGHILTLTQLDWPQEEDFVPPLMEQILQHGSFNYALFQNYIINPEILEEITYLWTAAGGQITLDIIPHLGQRRIGTRGADKGAKEEIRQVLKRQIARCNENVSELLIRFITQERTFIAQTLV